MRLQSLEVQGFKSFADKTVLDFHEGVTGIVGPNGCGKSNVVDAIRWVLGETSAKALRGGEMADVIFNGTDSRRASGMAAVSLILTDCEAALGVDYNEVAITRRVFRDGKSEYRINNTLCRLRDIHDLFLDTGIGRSAYSVMEQGKIDQLLSSKPEDRRSVFEEAAGISKFKKEKKEALRKLELTSGNLLRVSDIIEEQERRIGSLKRQVAKARRYQTLSTDVKVLETHLAHQEYRELLAGRNHLKSSLQELKKKINDVEEKVPTLESTLTEQRTTLSKSEAEISETIQYRNQAESDIRNAEGQIKMNAERRGDFSTRIDRYKEEIINSKSLLTKQQDDLKDTIKQVSQIQERISLQQTTLVEHKEKVEATREQRKSIETKQKQAEQDQLRIVRKVASLNAQLDSARNSSVLAQQRATSIQEEHTTVEKSKAAATLKLSELAAKIAATLSQKQTLEGERLNAHETSETLKSELDTAHKTLRSDQANQASLSSRLEVLESHLSSGEGLGSGSQAVLSGLNDPALYTPLIKGTLSEAIQAKDQHIIAVESALGSRLESIIIQDIEAAKNIIEHLSLKSLGAAELLISPLIPSTSNPAPDAAPNSSIDWMLNLITAKDSSITNLLEHLLSKTLVVSDLETAFKIRASHPDLNFVTITGETLNADGFISGGKADDQGASTLRLQNEIKRLQSETRKQNKIVSESQKAIEKLTLKYKAAVAKLESIRTSLQEYNLTTNTLKADDNASQREITNLTNKLDSLALEKKRLAQQEKTSKDSLTELEEDLSSSKQERDLIEEALTTLESETKHIREAEVNSFDILSELQTAVAVERRSYDAIQRQQEPLQVRIRELMDVAKQRESEITGLHNRIDASHEKDKQLQDSIGNAQAGIKQFTEKLERLQLSIQESRQLISSKEVALSNARRDLLQLTGKRGKEDVSYTKIDLKLENLTNNQREKHQVELSKFTPDLKALSKTIDNKNTNNTPQEDEVAIPDADKTFDIDWILVEELSQNLRGKLDGLGAVNVDAIAEYEELEERHVFVRKQYEDLTNAKEELLNIIDRINKETTIMFSETFSAVQKNFRHMFKALFGEKGKSDLILTDQDDPLESGIEIIAKPPGKKLQSITLLSGGERSMTAVALLFSIYMVKPSPFCVLDELDAPLDESNISRFLNMLEEFINQSQFIIVTHNKRTMARCDVLYGVTMPELGVSRPVSMRLSQAEDIIDQNTRNKKSANAKTDKSQSPAANAAAQISS